MTDFKSVLAQREKVKDGFFSLINEFIHSIHKVNFAGNGKISQEVLVTRNTLVIV